MDVNSISSSVQSQASATASYSKTTRTGSEEQSTSNISASYSVDLSAPTEIKAADSLKGLSAEQIDVLKAGIAKSQTLMIETIMSANAKRQSQLASGNTLFNFGGLNISSDRFALPGLATDPEAARAAIEGDGPYSVNSVATRIMDLVTLMAGDDLEKVEKLRAAVEKGFEQAGFKFKSVTGAQDMPQITKDTHDEINKRFDALVEDINKKNSGNIQGDEE